MRPDLILWLPIVLFLLGFFGRGSGHTRLTGDPDVALADEERSGEECDV